MNCSGKLKLIILLGVISIFFILISGCTNVTPDNNYNDDYDSYTVSYIWVSPSSATMKVSTSKLFTIYATYFTPERTGVYLVFANYKEKWDYSSVEVE
ncbi:hypothetical protein ES708_30657 [subsurface metagenome]